MTSWGDDEDMRGDYDRERWARTLAFLTIALCMLYLFAHMVAASLAGRW